MPGGYREGVLAAGVYEVLPAAAADALGVLALVDSLNVKRRNLTKSQAAIAAARLRLPGHNDEGRRSAASRAEVRGELPGNRG